MTDLLDTLRDIARTTVENDPTLMGKMLDSVTDGPAHPDEDADYLEWWEEQNQDWWKQQDEDMQQDTDFAEYVEGDR